MSKRLQGIGICNSIKAAELQVGMVQYFNYGYSYEIISIETSKTGKTLKAEIKSRTGNDAGKVYTQKYRASQDVVAGFVK